MNLFMLHSFQSWDNQYPKGLERDCFIFMHYYRLSILTPRTEFHQTIPSVTSFLITFSSVTTVKKVISISQCVNALSVVLQYVTMVFVEDVEEILEVRDCLTQVEVVHKLKYVTFVHFLR